MIRLLCIFFFLFSSRLFAVDSFTIEDVQSESDEESSLITLKFKGDSPDKIGVVEEHGTFIQISIPSTTSAKIGEFLDGNSPFFRKIALFSIEEGQLGIRLFTTQDPKTLLNSLTTQALKGRVLIHLDHKTVPPPLTGVPDIEDVVAKVKVRNDVVDPVTKAVAKDGFENVGGIALPSPNIDELLKDKMIYAAVFIGIMLIGLIGVLTFRKLMSRSGFVPQPTEKLTMRTISSFPISSKQHLKLIEVGNQKLLLGISADSINYLTEIDPQPKIAPVVPSTQTITNPSLSSGTTSRERSAITSGAKTLEPQVYKPKIDSHKENGAVPKAYKTEISKNTDQKSIEDVTNLIRRKLKNLPNV